MRSNDNPVEQDCYRVAIGEVAEDLREQPVLPLARRRVDVPVLELL